MYIEAYVIPVVGFKIGNTDYCNGYGKNAVASFR